MKSNGINRRKFLKGIGSLGMAAVSMQVLTRVEAQTLQEDALSTVSGPSRYAPLKGHFHTLSVPLAALGNPPEKGVSLATGKAYGHRHRVNLTQVQLIAIAQGQIVVVEDTVRDHVYRLNLPKA